LRLFIRLRRYRKEPARPLTDRSRRPHVSPGRSEECAELRIVAVRRRFGWRPEKIHDYLTARGVAVPGSRTVANILQRRGLIAPTAVETAPSPFFERSAPHHLGQCDHKGPLEIARQKVHPFTVLDDHSRYLLALRDPTIRKRRAKSNASTAPWNEKSGRVSAATRWPTSRRTSAAGEPRSIPPCALTKPWEGSRHCRDSPSAPGPRPAAMPEVEYASGSILRKVSTAGDVRWRKYRILAGRGLVGQWVRIEDRGHEVAL